MSTLAQARKQFNRERPGFEQLARRLQDEIRALVRARGLDCQVSARAKEVASFVGKCIRKGYTDPLGQVTDKVGARITVSDPQSIYPVVDLLRDKYQVLNVEDKGVALRAGEKIGYSGVHVQVLVAADAGIVGGECEIQVRTAAQNLWSEMSHRLLYKPGVETDEEAQRALLRLAALMEIFDEEVTRRVNQIVSTAGYSIEELINAAEAEFYRFAENEYDRSLSRLVLSEIAETLPTVQPDGYRVWLRAFVDDHESKLTEIFEKYRESDASQLVHQPEAIIIFERIDADIYAIRNAWDSRLPTDELEILESIWGP